MLQRDYFMKLTQMLVAVLAKVIFHKENNNIDDAQLELESAAKTMVGIDLKLISILSVEDILQLMQTSEIYAGRCIVTAELLKEYGDILDEKGKEEQSAGIYNKSLHLYIVAILTNEIPGVENYYPRVNFLINILSGLKLTPDFKQQLFKYYELSGQYSKAEDILFEMVEENVEGIEKKGIKFYERLKNISDEELLKGNLSRKEVDESLSEITTANKKNT